MTQQPSDPISAEEQKLLREVDEAGRSLNQQFARLGITSKSIQDFQKPAKEMNYSFNRRGDKLYTNQELHRQYNEASIFTRWATLPYCRRSIVDKCIFWLASAPVLAYSWGLFLRMRSDKPIEKIAKLRYMKYGVAFGLIGCTYSVIESLWFEDVCDINSYHYDTSEDRVALSRKIKADYRKI